MIEGFEGWDASEGKVVLFLGFGLGTGDFRWEAAVEVVAVDAEGD